MNREELIAAMTATAEQKPRAVKVKGWGTIYVRDVLVSEVNTDADELSAQFEKSIGISKARINLARSAARLICDEQGKLLFDPDNEADIKLLCSQTWKRVQKVVLDDDEADSGN